MMLPNSLIVAVLFYISTRQCLAEEIGFTSHFQLDSQQCPFKVQDQDTAAAAQKFVVEFTPSPSYPLPSTSTTTKLKSRPTTVYRPRSFEVLHRARLRSLQRAESEVEQPIWDPVKIEGPDVEDLHTLAQLARMSGNAYALPGQRNWYDVDQAWNTSFPFGWEESDGFRGQVFLSSNNSTVVLSIKGTTIQGPTSKLDKFNDNLLFSCCCARVDISWVFRTVCSCYSKHFRCDNRCLTNALVQDSLFYSIGVKLVDDLRKIHPSANVWLVGHSLGGALASLLGATYGLPAIAFESPGERLAASRLQLPLPPPIFIPHPPPPSAPSSMLHKGSQLLWSRLPYLKFPFPIRGKRPSKEKPVIIPPPSPMPLPPPSHHPIATTHVYHTADPIPQGTCTGFRSPCAQAGYALETRCHLGQSIVFDTVQRLRWKVDVRKHKIGTVVRDVLEGGVWWGDDGEEEGAEEAGEFNNPEKRRKAVVPKPIIERDCVDCYKWEFGNFQDEVKT